MTQEHSTLDADSRLCVNIRPFDQKLSLQYVDLQQPYIALVDMGMIWSMATPTAEDRQTQGGTPYKWCVYEHNVPFITLARHGDADRSICLNDPNKMGGK